MNNINSWDGFNREWLLLQLFYFTSRPAGFNHRNKKLFHPKVLFLLVRLFCVCYTYSNQTDSFK